MYLGPYFAPNAAAAWFALGNAPEPQLGKATPLLEVREPALGRQNRRSSASKGNVMDRRQMLAGISAAVVMSTSVVESVAQDAEANISLIRRYVEDFWVTGNAAILDEIVHPEIRAPYNDSLLPGRDAFKQAALLGVQERSQYPQSSYRLENVVADERNVAGVAIWSFTVNNKPPAQLPFHIFVTVRDGLIAEWIAALDRNAFDEYLLS
jgi:hypothetical protein